QDLSKTFQHLVRDLNIPTLFEPGIPGHAQTGQLSDLFTSQTRSPSSVERGQAKLFWAQAGTAGFQKIGQLYAAIRCIFHMFLALSCARDETVTATPMIGSLLAQPGIWSHNSTRRGFAQKANICYLSRDILIGQPSHR